MEYGASVCDPYQPNSRVKIEKRCMIYKDAMFVKSRYGRHLSVYEMSDELDGRLFLKKDIR